MMRSRLLGFFVAFSKISNGICLWSLAVLADNIAFTSSSCRGMVTMAEGLQLSSTASIRDFGQSPSIGTYAAPAERTPYTPTICCHDFVIIKLPVCMGVKTQSMEIIILSMAIECKDEYSRLAKRQKCRIQIGATISINLTKHEAVGRFHRKMQLLRF